jgi:O-ureido-D-serine cyclo-ligase
MRPILRIATTRPLPEPDPDEPLLLAALHARGIDARMVSWRDSDEPWEQAVATVVRSTWDYPQAPSAYFAWIERLAASGCVRNPPEILRANLHKKYLLELQKRGVAVIDTVMIDRQNPIAITQLFADRGWSKVVIKPAVSAASWMTLSFTRDQHEQAQEYLTTMTVQLDRDALIQPYMPEVSEHGERSLVWIDGEFTHSVRKNSRMAKQDEEVSPAEFDSEQLAVAQFALGEFADGADILYARVDLLRDHRGQHRVMELELCEPSLFLQQSPTALNRFADALARFATDIHTAHPGAHTHYLDLCAQREQASLNAAQSASTAAPGTVVANEDHTTLVRPSRA